MQHHVAARTPSRGLKSALRGQRAPQFFASFGSGRRGGGAPQRTDLEVRRRCDVPRAAAYQRRTINRRGSGRQRRRVDRGIRSTRFCGVTDRTIQHAQREERGSEAASVGSSGRQRFVQRARGGGGVSSTPLGKARALDGEDRDGVAMCWGAKSYDRHPTAVVQRVRRRLLKSGAARACRKGA